MSISSDSSLFSGDLPPSARAELSGLLEGILDVVPAHLAVLDESGLIVVINQAWRAFADANGLGDPRYGLGTNYLTLCDRAAGADADTAHAAGAGLRQILSGERALFTLEYPCHRPGEQRWFFMRASSFSTQGRRYAVVLHENITGRVLAEDHVRSLTRFPEENPNPVLRIGRDGEVLFANEAGRAVIQSWQPAAEANLLPFWPETLQTALTTGQRTRLELIAGERIYLFEVVPIVQPAYVNVYGYDITEQKHAEQARLEEQRQLQTLIDNLPDYIYIKDSQSRFILSNPAQAHLLGAGTPEATVGRTDFDFYPHAEAARFFADEQAILQTGEPLLNREESATNQSTGQQRWLYTSKVPLHDTEGRISGLVGIGRDVTGHKIAEQLLEQSESRYRSLFEHLLNGYAYLEVIFADGSPADAVFLDVNSAFGSLTGLRDAIGKKASALLPGIRELDPRLYEQYRRVALGGEPERFELFVAALQQWVAGSLYSPVPGYIVCLFDVVTERKQAEARIRQLNRMLSVLSDINQSIVRIESMATLFATACQIAVNVGGFRMAWIGLVDTVTGWLRPTTHAGEVDGYLETIDIQLNGDQSGYSPGRTAALTGQHAILNDVEHDPRPILWRELALNHGYRSVGAFPLTVAGAVRGVFVLYSSQLGFFDADELSLLDEMAADLSFAMEYAERETQRQQAEADLRASEEKYRSLIESTEAAISVFDRDGVLLFANPIALNTFYAAAAKPVGQHIDSLFPPLAAQSQLDNIRGVIRAGQGMVSEAYRADVGGGRWYRTSTQPVLDTAGAVSAVLVSAVDISALKQAEAALQGARDTLERRVVERTAELSEAKIRLEAILNNTTDAIVLASLQNGIEQANSMFSTLFACEPDDCFGRSLLTLVHPDDRDRLAALSQAVIADGARRHAEFQAVRNDVTTFEARIGIGYVSNQDIIPDGLVCSIDDITASKQATAALTTMLREELEFQGNLKALHEITLELAQVEELDEFYRRTVEQGRERLGFDRLALFLYDEATHTAVGTYGTDTTGALIAEHDLRFVPVPEGVMGRALLTPQRFRVDEGVPLLDGQGERQVSGWHAAAILWNGTRNLGWLVTDNLLSQRPASKPLLDSLALYALSLGALLAQKQTNAALRASEANLRESQQMLHTVLETLPVRVFWKDRDSNYLGANRLYVQDTGFTSSEQLVGKNDFELSGREYATDYRADDRMVMQTGTPRLEIEEQVSRADGKTIWVQTNKIPLRDGGGAIVGVIGAYVEITKLKQAEEELRRALEQQKDLVDLKARFISMASHDFRTPLSVILSSVSLLEMQITRQFGADQLEPLQKRIQRIATSVQQITSLLEDVLTVNRADTGKIMLNPEALDIEQLGQEILQEIKVSANNQHLFSFSFAGTEKVCLSDKQLLRQILVNLLSNAVKYSPEGGRVGLAVTRDPEWLELRVQDEGIGIPEMDQAAMFEIFHRARNVGEIQGTGLGMAIVKRAVDALNGTISFESQVNVGTTFTVRLPTTPKTE